MFALSLIEGLNEDNFDVGCIRTLLTPEVCKAVNDKNKEKDTPIYLSCIGKHVFALSFLLEFPIQLDWKLSTECAEWMLPIVSKHENAYRIPLENVLTKRLCSDIINCILVFVISITIDEIKVLCTSEPPTKKMKYD